MPSPRWLLADAVLWDGQMLRSAGVQVSPEGILLGVGTPPPGAEVERLPRRLLLPGLVDVHSHAFQRTLRGRTQARSPGVEVDDFWTWREVMYRAAMTLDPEGVYLASRQCFLEMALAGITSVGEFHYLHHQPDGTPYADPLELAVQVIRAAREVGLRIVLLRAGYTRAGFKAPDNPRQRRFYDRTPEAWLRAAADLRARVAEDPLVTVGIAPHSVRAVPRSWLEEAARSSAWLVHMHVAEQPEEVVVCQAEHGRRPVELLADLGLLSPGFTAVHAVHVMPHERLLLRGASVCACPTTERDLGDGVLAADGMARAGVRLCIGTDSQVTLDLFDELRAMEGSLRLTRGRRAVLDAPDGPDGLGLELLSYATENGARTLGLPSGVLRPGAPADLCTVDLDHPSLLGMPQDARVASVVFGAPAAAVRDVAVQGRWVVRDGRHRLAEESGRAYNELCQKVFQA
jgi:formimidoylglutamate deiminase